MSYRTSLTLAAVTAAFVLAACQKKESVDSRDVTTHGMSLELEVKGDGVRNQVRAALHIGSHETLVYARLTDGEQLIITEPSGDKRALSVLASQAETMYGTELPPGAGTYLLDFIRVKGAASALGNKVEVPAAFTLKAPATAARKEPLTFTWDAAVGSGAAMTYTLRGDCIFSTSKEIVGDPGTFTINAGEIKTVAGKEMANCPLTLRVTRARTTNACCSADFGHKSISRGIQERTVTFESTP